MQRILFICGMMLVSSGTWALEVSLVNGRSQVQNTLQVVQTKVDTLKSAVAVQANVTTKNAADISSNIADIVDNKGNISANKGNIIAIDSKVSSIRTCGDVGKIQKTDGSCIFPASSLPTCTDGDILSWNSGNFVCKKRMEGCRIVVEYGKYKTTTTASLTYPSGYSDNGDNYGTCTMGGGTTQKIGSAVLYSPVSADDKIKLNAETLIPPPPAIKLSNKVAGVDGWQGNCPHAARPAFQQTRPSMVYATKVTYGNTISNKYLQCD